VILEVDVSLEIVVVVFVGDSVDGRGSQHRHTAMRSGCSLLRARQKGKQKMGNAQQMMGLRQRMQVLGRILKRGAVRHV
jgi:hypothetical protein